MFFTTCLACGNILHATFQGQETHPTCEPTEAEKLARQFVDAVQRHDAAEADRLEKLVNKADEPPALGSAALYYASIGWPVLPLKPDGKLPALPSAHPDGDPLRGKCKGECGRLGHGLHDASTDADQIQQWWTRNPQFNIGLRTGIAFDVIDIDGPDGIRSLAELGDDVLPDIHGKVSTPRGLHYFVAPTGDGNRAGVRKGIDYRGQGGFVVASPSIVDGKRYSWLMRPSPEILGADLAKV